MIQLILRRNLRTIELFIPSFPIIKFTHFPSFVKLNPLLDIGNRRSSRLMRNYDSESLSFNFVLNGFSTQKIYNSIEESEIKIGIIY